MTIRILGPGDEAALDAFLATYPDVSLFARSGLRQGGIVDRGEYDQATYAVAMEDGRIVAMACHFWNGNLHLVAPVRLLEVARAAIAASGRDLRALIGPWDQVEAAEAALAPRPPSLRSPELLYRLDLGDLTVPALLSSGAVTWRLAVPGEMDLLVPWRMAYRTAIGAVGADLEGQARQDMERMIATGDVFVLESAGVPVAFHTFNARIPDTVQIGGVWTPPEYRGRGYARSVVAGSLLHAMAAGATRSILFTDVNNRAAQTAYLSRGYRQVGRFGAILYWE